MIAANNGYVLAFDNLSGLPSWLSDALCRLATGSSFAVRQLYTDDEERWSAGRFVTPNSANATVVQRTIQLIPRLPEPTLVTAVLVEDNVLVKKDQPLFQFDRRPYEYKVAQIEAQLAEAKQNVDVLRADVEVSTQKALRTKVELDYQLYQKGLFR
jgi:multidrug resistance efflux pump